ncbi:helix-turn-helix transcriptional regulator [Lentzea sp. NPDC051838]|uniref:helix-turn-helix transcriptional regulator n=1 Tax=Lentzea sp. NPDC051838 TaxID=3154849 RepID=UPI00342EBD69
MTALSAELAWREGDTASAIATADRILTEGTDQDCLAAGVAAAAAAADGALFDAAARWRVIATSLTGAPAVAAAARAALAACLAGDLATATEDLAGARSKLSGAAPRGLTVLLDGVDAALQAVRGEVGPAVRKLAGLSAATVPADPMAAEQWGDLAVTALIAGGHDSTAVELLEIFADHPTPRRHLLTAWLHLRAGRLAAARTEIAACTTPVLRRDALLAAAVTIGLARRTGDEESLRATWRRVAPVVAGVDLEPLLLDAWGELSAGAGSAFERDTIVDAMTAAVTRVNAKWCTETDNWWRVQRAVVAGEKTVLVVELTVEPRASAARMWADILSGNVDPVAVTATADRLATAGHPWDAMALCGAAAARMSNPAEARELLSTGRALRARIGTEESGPTDGLSKRERAVGELLLEGLTHKEIGARLYISPKTVEQHVAKIRQKLAVGGRAELMASLRARLA